MADVPPVHDSNGDDAGIPRWLYVLGLIAVILIVLFLAMHFIFGGPMGHGMQSPCRCRPVFASSRLPRT